MKIMTHHSFTNIAFLVRDNYSLQTLHPGPSSSPELEHYSFDRTEDEVGQTESLALGTKK